MKKIVISLLVLLSLLIVSCGVDSTIFNSNCKCHPDSQDGVPYNHANTSEIHCPVHLK